MIYFYALVTVKNTTCPFANSILLSIPDRFIYGDIVIAKDTLNNGAAGRRAWKKQVRAMTPKQRSALVAAANKARRRIFELYRDDKRLKEAEGIPEKV
jgi:hypothetical protein